VLIWKEVKKFWKSSHFACAYLRVWYEFSPQQRFVESGKKMTKKVKEKTRFEKKNGKKLKKAKK